KTSSSSNNNNNNNNGDQSKDNNHGKNMKGRSYLRMSRRNQQKSKSVGYYLSDGRIVGGEDIEIEDVPYQVSVLVRGRHKCGGTIISDYWVLTAAHCAQFSQRMYSVRAGTVWKNQGGTIYEVDKVVNHENYRLIFDIPMDDIALLRLATPFVFGEACQPIDLPNKGEKVKPETQTVVTGWGDTKSFPFNGRLQMVVIPTISIESCREAYNFTKIPDEGRICAMTPDGGKDACQGDSGGPMVVDKRLVGIVSWGVECAVKGNPGIYTE
ncbi:GSCOCG00004374001-RA-CDS, partial [Cotesia congregata]